MSTSYVCTPVRLADIPLGIPLALTDFLMGYDYPGNIREFRNLVYRMSCLAIEKVADRYRRVEPLANVFSAKRGIDQSVVFYLWPRIA